MRLVRLSFAAVVLAMLAGLGAYAPVRADLCRRQLSDTSWVSCPPLVIGDPIDSTGGRVAFVPEPLEGGPNRSKVPERARVLSTHVGAFIQRAGGEIPTISFALNGVAGQTQTCCLLAGAPASGEIASGAPAVVIGRVGGTGGLHIVAGIPGGAPGADSAWGEVRSGGHLVQRAGRRMGGEIARLSAWPTGFSVRKVGGNVEYTWLLGGTRQANVMAHGIVTGDRITVTLPALHGGFEPVLLRANGFDRLVLRAGAKPVSLAAHPAPRTK